MLGVYYIINGTGIMNSTLTAHVISLMLFNSLVKQRNSDTPAVNLLPSMRRLWYELSLSLSHS
jgi:hypothetical protein